MLVLTVHTNITRELESLGNYFRFIQADIKFSLYFSFLTNRSHLFMITNPELYDLYYNILNKEG